MSQPVDDPFDESGETIICRPERSNWAGVWMLLFLAALTYAMMLVPRGEGVPPFTARERLGLFGGLSVIAVPCIVGAMWAALWIGRAAIVADGEKIIWRGVGAARGARWEEVLDFHFVRVKSSTHYSVETSGGRLRFGASWTNESALAACIARRAIHARARKWEPREARSDAPWPRRFSYASFENRWLLPLSVLVLVPYGAVPLAGLRSVREVSAHSGWLLGALMAATIVAASLMMPLLIYVGAFQVWRAARKRRDERVEATVEGIAWTNGERSISSTWGDVRAFHAERVPGLAEPVRFHVETSQGNWSFSGQISHAPLLKSTIGSHASQASPSTWDLKSAEASEKPAEMPSAHGTARVFHYRTPTNRALLWFVAALPLLPIVAALIWNWAGTMEEGFVPKPLPYAPTIVGLILFGWAWWRMRAAAIVVSDEGIAQASFNGVHFLSWARVTRYFHTPESYWVNVLGVDETGHKVALRFWISIGALEELRDEIERRALHAAPRGWSDRPPST